VDPGPHTPSGGSAPRPGSSAARVRPPNGSWPRSPGGRRRPGSVTGGEVCTGHATGTGRGQLAGRPSSRALARRVRGRRERRPAIPRRAGGPGLTICDAGGAALHWGSACGGVVWSSAREKHPEAAARASRAAAPATPGAAPRPRPARAGCPPSNLNGFLQLRRSVGPAGRASVWWTAAMRARAARPSQAAPTLFADPLDDDRRLGVSSAPYLRMKPCTAERVA
jgi:hypothetical protein